jgi:hypothetical protein
MYSTTDKRGIMDPMTLALLGSGLSAIGSIGGSALSRRKPRESKTQKQKRQLVDDLLASLRGGGTFSDLFAMDDDAFQKSFVEPAKARFSGQIAPQIQQSFIASGQQRGTGLDDTLTRAGVDMDQLLNEQFMNFQQGALNRRSGGLSGILGGGEGVQPGISYGQAAREGASGFLAGDTFSNLINEVIRSGQSGRRDNQPQNSIREGFAL